MNTVEESFRQSLFDLQDAQYREFHKKLVPNVAQERIIGVRVPHLRSLAQRLFKEKPGKSMEFCSFLPHLYVEENTLHGLLIENIKDFDKAMAMTEIFLPYIDNWATCDIFSPKIFKKHPQEVYKKIQRWLKSRHTYTLRYAVGLLLSNFLGDKFKPSMLELVAAVESQEYYVRMMVAWHFSMALVKQYDFSLPYLKLHRLDPWTHNKTIQKVVESRQFTKERKNFIKALKIVGDKERSKP